MKIALGAPVAERAWILPLWWECLRKQTLQPDNYCFVYSDSQDGTLEFLEGLEAPHVDIYKTVLPYFSRNDRNADRKDPWRAIHLSKLRNRLRTRFLQTDADVFVSLDTDILLEDPEVLERLVGSLTTGRWDVMAARTSLHAVSEECYNAGWFADANHGAHTQAWRRAELNDVVAYRPPIKIEIPMAFFAIRRFALGMCAYQAHETGEDVGFAQQLRAHKFRVGWQSDLVVKHVWGPEWLAQEQAA